MAALVRENRERKELLKQAKLKAITEEQAAKMKKLEEEMEEKKKAAEVEAAAEAEEERKRREEKGESSGMKEEEAELEKKISEWITNLSLGEDEEAQMYVPQDEKEALARALATIEDPLERQETEEEKKLEQEVQAQIDISAKMDKMLGYLEVLSEAWLEERQANWGHDVALSAMRSGFRDFVRDLVTHVGGEVRRLRENVGKFCEGAIESAKAVAAVESEARPRKEPVKLKFPYAYGGKKEENFDNWEASVNSYVYLQHILTEEQVLVAFQTLKDEAASFARSLVRAAGCENNLIAYSKISPLPQFFKLLRERTLQEHQGHLRQVLEKLREANFKINEKKCEWAKTQVLYLGHVLDGDGIKPEDSKMAAIRDWPTPRTLTELRSFLGLANYYREFMRNFSTIVAPLRRFLKKEAIWQWYKDCPYALKKLKRALIEYPVLKVVDPSLPFVVTTDASQYGIGVVLQQDDGNGYRPVEFMSARMPSEKVATSTKMSDHRAQQQPQVEVVMKVEGQQPSTSTPPSPPLTATQQEKKEMQEQLRRQQEHLAELERQEAAELEAATDNSRRDYLLQQLDKVLSDGRCAQVTKHLAETIILEHKITSSYFTNWDDRFDRLERRVDSLAAQQSKILDAIQNLTAQLSAAKLIAPQLPLIKPKPSPPSTPPSSPPGSVHSSRSPSHSQRASGKATYAVVTAGDERGPKIPAPNKFRGDDPKTDVGDWAAGTKASLRGFVCAEQTKVGTVLGLLEGPALKWATSTSSSLQQSMEDWAFGLGVDKLLQALEDRFADKERARKAVDRIARLGQQRYSGTLQALSQRFFWKEMRSDMLRYVDTCELCQRNKVHRRPPLGLLKPLPIPDGLAESVEIDFTDLGKTTPRGMRQVIVCVDRFSKYAEFIPLPEVARVPAVRAAFSERWVTHHGPPTSIVSDRDPSFCNDECQSYCKDYLHSRLDMTSGDHPEANGQAEVMNQVLFQLLRPVISPDQQDWDLHLARAQLMYNMSVHSSTGFSPYRLHWGHEPRQPLDDIIDKAKPDLTPGTTKFTRCYRLDVERARANLFKAQKAMVEQANRHRWPSPIRTGDYVWVASSELSREEDISPKLLPRYLGPWQVLDRVGADPFGPSYVIDVPLHLRTYPVFHASKLLPFTRADAFPDWPPQFGPPILGKGYDMEWIEDEWRTGPDRQYLVRFAFQPPSENRWFYRRELLKTAKPEQRQLGMPYAREDPSVALPVKREKGLEISLSRRVKEGEYVSSLWDMSIDKGIFIWIESGFDDDQECAIVRVTLYAPPSFWVLHEIELALGHGSLLTRPLGIAEGAATKWARGRVLEGEEQVETRIEIKLAEEFALPSAPLRVVLPEFLIEKSFGGQARVEAATEAVAGTSILAEGNGFVKILLWRNTCLSKALLCESVSSSMPPDLRALLFQGRNLSAFLCGYHDFALAKMWDEKAMWSMLPLFVCEELSEEVYTLMLKSQTWNGLEASLKSRFPEDRTECQLGEGPMQPAGVALTQGELSGLQRQVGILEERLTRLEEARRGKRKVHEGISSGPIGQDGTEARDADQDSLLRKGTPKRRACPPERDGGERVIEIKEEQESSIAPPVIASDPKKGLINVEASSTANRKEQRSKRWQEHWAKIVCDRCGKIGHAPRRCKEKGVTGKKGEPEPPKLTTAQRKARNLALGS
ncbi:hypothetical protein CBR_g41603 [Chara braunii]|uniref:Integrase catalytic domain-containing protein n=1 Tax=Chara braunii TaxID=69332 RepID=A0A388LW35_CHABU|nr:hypothetical protein CBR_g41603 [Chara braunii]|eukprot:GBG86540.1 hypothetical protein CBR_g41603 [Chara braunii]